MLTFAFLAFAALCSASPMVREQSDGEPLLASTSFKSSALSSFPAAPELKPIEPIVPLDPFFSFNEGPGVFTQIDADGIAAATPKKTEKLPLQKPHKHFDSSRPIPDVLSRNSDVELTENPPGVPPMLSGSFVSEAAPAGFDYFDFGEGAVAATNPAATYLEGGNFDKIAAPICRMTGCTGPLPNDGSFSLLALPTKGKACHQTFVPMNSCTDDKGYSMGMLCTICCECSKAFVGEMKKTHGFKIGLDGN